jgi:hypothetical protein
LASLTGMLAMGAPTRHDAADLQDAREALE